MARQSQPPVDLIRLLFHYETHSGRLVRRSSGEFAESRSGRQGNDYFIVRIAGATCYAHRVAWAYVNGRWPSGSLDHIDGDRFNNRITNLREATHQQNARNAKPYLRKSSLPRGVYASGKKFKACIRYSGRLRHLGQFDTAELAAEFYQLACVMCFGEFAPTTFKHQP